MELMVPGLIGGLGVNVQSLVGQEYSTVNEPVQTLNQPMLVSHARATTEI